MESKQARPQDNVMTESLWGQGWEGVAELCELVL